MVGQLAIANEKQCQSEQFKRDVGSRVLRHLPPPKFPIEGDPMVPRELFPKPRLLFCRPKE